MHKFGLIGKHISYSFSKEYFNHKFQKENIHASYENFDLETIEKLPSVLKNVSNLKGLNVTIPYKESVIPYLDKLDKKAKKIGAVNTIKITSKGQLKGYNTDCYGFKKSLKPLLKSHHKRALILGTGGASKAISYTLNKLNIDSKLVSRKASKIGHFTYNALTENLISNHQIIINCTPLGTFPNVTDCPKIPYQALTKNHILYDLIYNPTETQFLALGRKQGATTINGLNMLKLQANKAWTIWNK